LTQIFYGCYQQNRLPSNAKKTLKLPASAEGGGERTAIGNIIKFKKVIEVDDKLVIIAAWIGAKTHMPLGQECNRQNWRGATS
jgi:hypothetical protein